MQSLTRLIDICYGQFQASTCDAEALLASDLKGKHEIILVQLWMIASRMQDDLERLDELVAEAGPDTRGADLLLSARATL